MFQFGPIRLSYYVLPCSFMSRYLVCSKFLSQNVSVCPNSSSLLLVCSRVSQYAVVLPYMFCPKISQYIPIRSGLPYCVLVCSNMSQHVLVCPKYSKNAPERHCVSYYVLVCPNIGLSMFQVTRCPGISYYALICPHMSWQALIYALKC